MVNLNAMQLPSDYEVHCSSYEDSDNLLSDDLNCSLPFDAESTRPICKSYDEGLKVVKSRLAYNENFQRTCKKLEIDYKEQPDKYLLSSVRPKYSQAFIDSSEDEIGYVFEMPKYANLISYLHEYSLPVAFGYFGSIVGIFMGISVISVLSWFTNYINVKSDIKKWGLLITQIGMSIYLLIISILLMNMFLQYPRDTSVNFVKTTSDFSMTICSSTQIYGVSDSYRLLFYNEDGKPVFEDDVHVSYDMFWMTNESFWLKWSDPRNIIDTLKIDTGSNEIDLLDKNFPKKNSFLPVDNQTVAACHTFHLSEIKEIDSISLIYNEEIQVYFHNTGQLLNEWVKKQNLILAATKENVQKNENILNVYNTAVILKMERQLKLDEEGGQSYDECVIDYGREALGVNPMKCFFSKGYNNCTDIISNSFLTNVRNLLQSQNKCALPTNILLTSADKSVSLYRVVIKTDDMDLPEYDDELSLGIKDNSQARKPKIEFFLPKFTKLSQVSQL